MRSDDLRSAHSERFLTKDALPRPGYMDDSFQPRSVGGASKLFPTSLRLHKKIKKRLHQQLPSSLFNTKRNRLLNAVAFNGSVTMSDTRNSRNNVELEKESDIWDGNDATSSVGLVSNANEWEKFSCVTTSNALDDIQSRMMRMRLGSRHN